MNSEAAGTRRNLRPPVAGTVPARPRAQREGVSELFLRLVPPFLLTLFFWSTSDNPVEPAAAAAALGLAIFPWWSYLNWRGRQKTSFPLFAVLSSAYWLYFAFPLFWGKPLIRLYQFLEVSLTSEAVTKSMIMALAGVTLIALGIKSGIGRHWVADQVFEVSNDQRGRTYLRGLLLLGTLFSLIESLAYILGEGGRQIILTLTNLLPLVVAALLLREVIRGVAQRLDFWLMAGFLVIRFLVGISSGWLGSLAVLIVIVGVLLFEEKRRVPVLAVVLVFVSFLFLQAGKREFRQTYWGSSVSVGKLDRALFWLGASFQAWEEDLQDPSGAQLRESVYSSFERLSLLPQTANVVELTPRVVPHQGAQLYSYLAVTLIPRFLWPGKPSVNEANRLYQVAYGLTTEEDLDNTSIAVGVMTEGYIAFGWIGMATVMFLMGVFYDYAERTFMSHDSGRLFRSIGVVLVFHFIGIEGQAAQYVGGLVQQIAVIFVALLPVLRIKPRKLSVSRERFHWRTAHPARSSS